MPRDCLTGCGRLVLPRTPDEPLSVRPASAMSASCDLTLAGQTLRRVGPGGLSPFGNGNAQVTASVDVDPAW